MKKRNKYDELKGFSYKFIQDHLEEIYMAREKGGQNVHMISMI